MTEQPDTRHERLEEIEAAWSGEFYPDEKDTEADVRWLLSELGEATERLAALERGRDELLRIRLELDRANQQLRGRANQAEAALWHLRETFPRTSTSAGDKP